MGRFLCIPAIVGLALFLAACGGHGAGETQASAEPSAAPSAPAVALSSEPSAGPSTSPTPGGTATPEPTPTPDTNLLSWKNGAIARSYPVQALGDGDASRLVEHTPNYVAGATGPFVYVFELPGPASITAFTALLPSVAPSAAPSTVGFAVSTTGATGPFKDAGTLTATADDGLKTLPVSIPAARWVQVTANGPPFNFIGATGNLEPMPSGVSPIGIYVELNSSPIKNGAFNPIPNDTDPWYRKVVTFGSGMTAVRCFNGHAGDAYPGDLDGRTWTFKTGDAAGRAIVNDDASMIVGSDGNGPLYLMRSSQQPKFCSPTSSGNGPHHTLVLDAAAPDSLWPVDKDSLPGYSFERMHAGMFDAAALAGKEIVILNGLCDSSHFLGKGQTDALLQWVNDGHKLLIFDADECSKSVYDFIPYQFTSSNPGARGAHGDRLILVESNALGSSDKSDTAHYLDAQAWAKDPENQLGDANTVTSSDSHWCGHLFGTNSKNVNGFMEMYATYGKGTIIFGGFDTDDGGLSPYQRLRTLEFALPVPNDLPCTQKVTGSFVIQPNQEGSFTAGKATTLKFPMELLANQGWSGHVNVATTGDFPAAVTPASFDVSGGTQGLSIAVTIPQSTKPGAYSVAVTGAGDGGNNAQALITFTGTAPLKKTVIQKHQRIRIYGIHFDYDSAHIQPRSEPVIADIASLMRSNPSWHFEVSGHTDSDGGAAYNLALSQRRAQSVVNDLVSRYHIARSRLVAKGYGLTRPVASNATDAGKALNRRVELERLQ